METEPLKTMISKLESWSHAGVKMLPNFVVACVVIILFALLGKLLAKWVSKGVKRSQINDELAIIAATTAKIIVIGTGIFIALGLLKLDKTVTSMLAGVGVIGLALGFAFQDIATNFVAGIMMAFRQPFRVGDTIESNSYQGNVHKIELRATTLKLFTGQEVLIPNKQVLQNPIVNYTHPGKRRVDLVIGASYGDNLDKVKSIAHKAIENIDYRDKSQDIELYFTAFGDSSINLSVRFWLDLDSSYASFLEARSQAIVALKTSFDEAELTIPFPIRTLDFGIVGGQNLSESLAKPN